MSINRENQEGFLEISFVFSGPARYFNTEYLTFFHNQKSLFTQCELYKDVAEKAYRQYKHFSPIEIKSTINQEMDWDLSTVFSTNREAVKSYES